MSTPRMFLYVKTGCPWCIGAEEFLQAKKLPYEKVDVRQDAAAYEKLKEISGQDKAPTMEFGEEREVFADFSAEELEVFLKERGVL